MYKSYMKNALYLAAEEKMPLGKHCSCPLFDNVIKNTITSSETHIIVCLLKTE